MRYVQAVTETDIDHIEQALGLSLPDFYKEAARSGQLDKLLNADARAVIAINQDVRKGYYGDNDWPSQCLLFADDGGGDLYCLDTASGTSKVLQRDHETCELFDVAEDFTAWLDAAEDHR